MTRVICTYYTVPRASFMTFFYCFCVIISAINNGVWLVFQKFLRNKLIGCFWLESVAQEHRLRQNVDPTLVIFFKF